MPHKRNPVVSEQICGLARVVRSNAQAAFENVALWHERDISHSSVERVILADSAILTDYLLAKTRWLVEGMRVYPERMLKNLESTQGLIFSGQLLLDLAAAGMLREQAYKLVQTHAMRSWEGGTISGPLSNQIKKYFLFLRLKRFERLFPWTASSPTWTVSSAKFSAKTLRINNLPRSSVVLRKSRDSKSGL